MFARILLRFWPTTFKNPVCWGFCIHCGQPSAKAAASPREILHRTKDRVMTCLIRGFMRFSFLESLGLGCYIWGKRSLEKICENCQDNFATGLLPETPQLFRPQRGHGGDSCGALRGKEAGEKRSSRQHEARRNQCERIVRAHLVENLGKHPADGEGEEQSEDDGQSCLHRT